MAFLMSSESMSSNALSETFPAPERLVPRLMPRIMTMNGDQQSVATAPLDLRTTHRERGSAGPGTPPDCKGRAGDARVTGGSPAPPASTGTDTLEIRCPVRGALPGSETGASRKRSADRSSSRLPFRKRQFHVEPESQRQSPAPAQTEDRCSSAVGADLTSRESFPGRATDESRVSAVPVTPRRNEEAAHSPNGFPIRVLHPFDYGPFPVYCLPPVPEPSHPLVHQTENLLAGIALATRQDEDGDTALHIAVVQGELAIFYKLMQLLLWAHRSLDIYNNLRQDSGKQELKGGTLALTHWRNSTKTLSHC